MILVFREKRSKFKDTHCVQVLDAGTLYGGQFVYFKPRQGFVSDGEFISDGKSIESLNLHGVTWLANGLNRTDANGDYIYEVEILHMSPELKVTFRS